MGSRRRREVLAAIPALVPISLPGCGTLSSGDGGERPTTEDSRDGPASVQSSAAPSAGATASSPTEATTSSATGTTTPSPAGSTPNSSTPDVSDLERECVTADFTGYTGTTPLPRPSGPASTTWESAVDYALEYERYYQRYLALYEVGSPTPEYTNLPAHDIPEVRLTVSDQESENESDGGWIVRFRYDLAYQLAASGDYAEQGERTVAYFVAEEHTIRAEGDVDPAPDPLEDGHVMTC